MMRTMFPITLFGQLFHDFNSTGRVGQGICVSVFRSIHSKRHRMPGAGNFSAVTIMTPSLSQDVSVRLHCFPNLCALSLCRPAQQLLLGCFITRSDVEDLLLDPWAVVLHIRHITLPASYRRYTCRIPTSKRSSPRESSNSDDEMI